MGLKRCDRGDDNVSMASNWNIGVRGFLDSCREQDIPSEVINVLESRLRSVEQELCTQGVDTVTMPKDSVQKYVNTEIDKLGTNKGETECGAGSFVENTAEVRLFVEQVIREYGIKTMLDVPCGDWNWMRLVDLQDVKYTGHDLDDGFIAENRHRYPQHSFETIDALNTEYSKYDLICCRDFMIHIPTSDGLKLIDLLRASGSKWLMATSYDYLAENLDLSDEQKSIPYSRDVRVSRMVNLTLPPYDFSHPVDFVRENDSDGCAGRIVGLWRLND